MVLLTSDWGKAHQVKIIDPKGRLLQTIGKPGGSQRGLYDEHRMSHPCGVAIDGQGRLWVAESENAPKRLSSWKADGSFLKALYGPAKYGGGGALDPRDSAGQEILADVGLLRGKEGRTMQRAYWSNKDTVLISDLPSEARLHPERWGIGGFADGPWNAVHPRKEPR